MEIVVSFVRMAQLNARQFSKTIHVVIKNLGNLLWVEIGHINFVVLWLQPEIPLSGLIYFCLR